MVNKRVGVQMSLKAIKLLILSAYGNKIWKETTKLISENDIVLVMPENDDELNYYSLLYIDQYIEENKKKECVVITNNKKVISNYKYLSEKITRIEKLSNKKIRSLIQFYCLYKFDERVLFASLSKPNGRNAERILGKNGIRMEDIVAIGIFQLKRTKTENDLSLPQKNSKKIFNIEK